MSALPSPADFGITDCQAADELGKPIATVGCELQSLVFW